MGVIASFKTSKSSLHSEPRLGIKDSAREGELALSGQTPQVNHGTIIVYHPWRVSDELPEGFRIWETHLSQHPADAGPRMRQLIRMHGRKGGLTSCSSS